MLHLKIYFLIQGKDIKLILEGESLKLVEPKTKTVLLVQRIVKMRVWGVGKEDQRFVNKAHFERIFKMLDNNVSLSGLN